jgi:hypothetical protein
MFRDDTIGFMSSLVLESFAPKDRFIDTRQLSTSKKRRLDTNLDDSTPGSKIVRCVRTLRSKHILISQQTIKGAIQSDQSHSVETVDINQFVNRPQRALKKRERRQRKRDSSHRDLSTHKEVDGKQTDASDTLVQSVHDISTWIASQQPTIDLNEISWADDDALLTNLGVF